MSKYNDLTKGTIAERQEPDTITTDNTNNLLPCPHCGSEAKIMEGLGEYWVSCINRCSYMGFSKSKVIESWNKRVKTYTIQEPELKVGDKVYCISDDNLILEFRINTIGFIDGEMTFLEYEIIETKQNGISTWVNSMYDFYKTKKEAEQALKELNKDGE